MNGQQMLDSALEAYGNLVNLSFNSIDAHANAIAIVEKRGKSVGHPGHPGWFTELTRQQREKSGTTGGNFYSKGTDEQIDANFAFRAQFAPTFEAANAVVNTVRSDFNLQLLERVLQKPFSEFQNPQNVAELIAYGGTPLQKREAAIQSEYARRNNGKQLSQEEYLAHVRTLDSTWEAISSNVDADSYTIAHILANRGEHMLEPSDIVEDLFGYRGMRAVENPQVHIPQQFVSDFFTLQQLDGLENITRVYANALGKKAGATVCSREPQWPGHHYNLAKSAHNKSASITLPENTYRIPLKSAK